MLAFHGLLLALATVVVFHFADLELSLRNWLYAVAVVCGVATVAAWIGRRILQREQEDGR